MANWQDTIVGDRMTVDKEFNQEVLDSEFSNQEWDLIMSAIEFEIENPENPEEARIVANDEKLSAVIPELEKISQQMQGMGGAPGGSGGSSGGGGGLFDSVKSALGMGGGGKKREAERTEAASKLASEYAETLQAHLESKGKWDSVCARAEK
ncbi:DUF5799 family protein [Haloarchaeobius sp. HME9146]|uniref:DUF5799 family protein n=1 Tax=Haloarchaeobius sp. HME9146 TaxID=2978732 RepID=UPI0021C04BB3|nr:DUF5799 family protein [Haloarchaeobius sp. HME9146]MCT9097070.1 DUF5799 family protein [Haloarchaeobius sp. HME9146]